jgi:hypothetical protein
VWYVGIRFEGKYGLLLGSTPCIPLKVDRRFGGTFRLHLQGRRMSQVRNQYEEVSNLDSCFAYCSTLKLAVTCSSEISTDFQRTTRHSQLSMREPQILYSIYDLHIHDGGDSTFLYPLCYTVSLPSRTTSRIFVALKTSYLVLYLYYKRSYYTTLVQFFAIPSQNLLSK